MRVHQEIELLDDELRRNFDTGILPGDTSEELLLPIYTRPLQETRFVEFCQDNGIVAYLPLKKVLRVKKQTVNGKDYEYAKTILRPMFPSYVFAKLNTDQRSQVFRSNAIVHILSENPEGQNALIRDVLTIRSIELASISQELDFNAQIKEGDRFFMESGPFQGTYGYLVRKDNLYQWTIQIECLGQLVRATLDPITVKITRA